jgi:hypothetical protein
MDYYKRILDFINKLERNKIYYTIKKSREIAIMILVDVPGQIWEIEFLDDGSIEIEKYISNGHIYDENEIETLFKDFSD